MPITTPNTPTHVAAAPANCGQDLNDRVSWLSAIAAKSSPVGTIHGRYSSATQHAPAQPPSANSTYRHRPPIWPARITRAAINPPYSTVRPSHGTVHHAMTGAAV